jgi:hypothetical protein
MGRLSIRGCDSAIRSLKKRQALRGSAQRSLMSRCSWNGPPLGSFAAQILGRIRDAQSVVAVFLPNDPSTPIECALAVREGKRVLIIHQEGVRIPRLLAGLPGVETLVFENFRQRRMLEQISTFLARQ